MSALARSLLALAAAALLHGACADPQCTTVKIGSNGSLGVDVLELHLDQTDSITDLPPDDECPWYTWQVGVAVTACDPFGDAPLVELVNGDQSVHIVCTWTDGQQCPEGIDMVVQQGCA